ncbi:protein kinase domain-containing protein [Bremerella cremea]|uniref:protein kinase domain-containing protein n=1 Tax=Bremerella cremea TaxID=1031537 RepID=UPI0031EE5BC9
MSSLRSFDQLNSIDLMGLVENQVAGAASEIFHRYWPRLLPLIRQNLSARLRRRVDAEDVAQSSLQSFFVRARERQFRLDREGDLWRLLAAISVNKVRKQAQKHTAAKRSIMQEVIANPTELSRQFSETATPSQMVAIEEIVHQQLTKLPPEQIDVLTWYLAGEPLANIAQRSDIPARTLRRWVQQFRESLEHSLIDVALPIRRPSTTLAWEDYLLKQHVGSGGFGKVYRAVEKKRRRTVAIKSLHKRLQHDQAAVASFIQEANLLAKIHHPNVVGVHGLGQYPGGGYFLVLDWIDGEDLQQKLNCDESLERDALRIVRQVAIAVRAAHQAQIIHADLKPSNALVSRSGGIHITDFGLATLRSQGSHAILPRGGTLAYLAPEQLDDAPLDFCADIYGIGGLLFTLLTGRPPRVGTTAEITQQLKSSQPLTWPQTTSSGETIPPDVLRFLQTCLAFAPDERFASVDHLLAALAKLSWPVLS